MVTTAIPYFALLETHMKTMGPGRNIPGEEELKTGHLVDNSLTGRTIDFAIELFKSVIFLFYIFLFSKYTYILI